MVSLVAMVVGKAAYAKEMLIDIPYEQQLIRMSLEMFKWCNAFSTIIILDLNGS